MAVARQRPEIDGIRGFAQLLNVGVIGLRKRKSSIRNPKRVLPPENGVSEGICKRGDRCLESMCDTGRIGTLPTAGL